MSSCSSCSGVTCATLSSATAPASNPAAQRAKTIKAAADRLGLPVDDLKSALGAGKNLNQLAAARGVTHDDLIATISGVLGNGGAGPKGRELTDAAENIASGRTLRV